MVMTNPYFCVAVVNFGVHKDLVLFICKMSRNWLGKKGVCVCGGGGGGGRMGIIFKPSDTH